MLKSNLCKNYKLTCIDQATLEIEEVCRSTYCSTSNVVQALNKYQIKVPRPFP